MKKGIMTGFLAFLIHTTLFAQTVTFRSSDIENRVKYHLGLSASDNITRAQLDTITQLNLSSLGLTDINDVRLMPNLRQIDLSHNKINDIRPLALLDSLSQLDLSYNLLESINMLAFSNAVKMEVDVSFNKINDFSLFNTLTPCLFTFEGVGLQNWVSTSSFHVSYFYCDGRHISPEIYYRIESSPDDNVEMMVKNVALSVEADGVSHRCLLNGFYEGTCPVVVSNGFSSDTTYLVPSADLDITPGEMKTIPTGLPESYTINFANAVYGTVAIDGADLVYTAPEAEMCDTLSFSYYERGVLRGFSRYYLGNPRINLGDVNGDKVVNITDIMLIVNYIIGKTPSTFIKKNADVNSDKNINITDVMNVVNIVLDISHPQAPANARYDMDDKLLLTANNRGCSIFLDADAPFTACEMTLSLPDGCTLLDASLDSHQPAGHQMAIHNIGGGLYRLVVYAPTDGQTRLGEGALINLGLNGKSDGIMISDIMFSNNQYETVVLQDTFGLATGLNGVSSADTTNDTYSIQGIKTTTPRKGVYINNHKKKAIK